ncbi:MAG: HFLK protein [Faecalibacterium sp.]
MANGDYGYFGKGDTGYAQYMTAFNRNFGGSSGNGCGCLIAIAVVVVLVLIAMGS